MTTVLKVPAVALSSATPERAGATERRNAGMTLFWLTTVLTVAATLARNTWVFTQHVYEHGDAALITIMVQNSHHGLLLTGPVSRVGFPHPGPAYVYVVAAGQSLFHDWLPLAASAYGGQFIAVTLLQALLLGFVVRTLYRLTRSVPVGFIGLGLVFWFAASREMLGETWLPNLYMTTFALFIVSGVAVAIGVSRELPLFVFAGAMLIHGHVAFIFFVGVTWLLTGLSWLLIHRDDRGPALRSARRSLWWALGIVVVFAIPLVLEVTLHFPGPWPDYLSYGGVKEYRTVGDSARFLGHFWSASFPIEVTILAAAGAAAGLLLDQDRDRLRLFIRGYLMLLLQTLLFAFYIVEGIDALAPINYYTGFFYENVPMFLLVFAVLHLSLLTIERLPGRSVAGRSVSGPSVSGPSVLGRAVVGRRLLGWAAAVGVVALVVAGIVAPSLTMTGQSYPTAPALVAAVATAPDRAGQPTVLRFQHDEWSFVAATFVQARREGVSICVDDPYWRGLFTDAAMCPTTTGHWALADVARSTYHGGHKVIWSDENHVVYEGVLPNLPPATH